MTTGSVVRIFTCPMKGSAMIEVLEVLALKETGLWGDRYGIGQGSWSTPDTTHRQVSLIALEAIDVANEAFSEPFLAGDTRRNIVTKDVDLNSLVGKEFSIGEARLEGTKLCDPCERPLFLVGRSVEDRRLFPVALENQGGICARVIKDGLIQRGDSIIYD